MCSQVDIITLQPEISYVLLFCVWLNYKNEDGPLQKKKKNEHTRKDLVTRIQFVF